MLPALIVGALTAWYLGLKTGLIAAGVAFAAIVLAGLVPGMTITVYAVLIGWCAVLYFVGSRLKGQGVGAPAKGSGPSVLGMAGSAVGTVGKWVGKAKKMIAGNDK
jgi:hypothetical protein